MLAAGRSLPPPGPLPLQAASGSQPLAAAITGWSTAAKSAASQKARGVCETYYHCAAETEVTICKPNTGHGVYAATNIQVTAEGWKFLKRFHLQ